MAIVYTDRHTYHALAALVNDDVHRVAERIAAAARVRASGHTRTGQFAGSFSVERENSLDWAVVNSDPNAASIEFGHHTPNGTFVEGMHALGGALRDAAI